LPHEQPDATAAATWLGNNGVTTIGTRLAIILAPVVVLIVPQNPTPWGVLTPLRMKTKTYDAVRSIKKREFISKKRVMFSARIAAFAP
jgi:hypothetical protein